MSPYHTWAIYSVATLSSTSMSASYFLFFFLITCIVEAEGIVAVIRGGSLKWKGFSKFCSEIAQFEDFVPHILQ